VTGGSAQRLPDAAGYEVWLLRVGALDFEAGQVLPDRGVSLCTNALLLRGGGETVLVDAGSGPVDVVWPGANRLEEALAAAGARPDGVDVLVLTHSDFDHAGGGLAGTWPDGVRPAFPRAVVSAVDLDAWRPGKLDEWDVGTRLIAAYEAARALEVVEDGAEARPGLRLVSAPGHRPGHCVLLVGDELVHGADLLHHESHVRHPEWDHAFDADPEQALSTRRAWIARLAETGTPVVFTHLEGLGRISAGPRWEPVALPAAS
jgi:glyoxylase-like metal-dependent hydrolase (beta-lactamase superfamily II)